MTNAELARYFASLPPDETATMVVANVDFLAAGKLEVTTFTKDDSGWADDSEFPLSEFLNRPALICREV